MKRLTVLAGLLAVAGCAETPWSRGDLVAEPSACAPQRFDIYFRDGEAQLTDAARHAIGLTATQLQGCDIRKVDVIGLADARGGPDANLDLSERRAGFQSDGGRGIRLGGGRRGQRADAAADRGAGRGGAAVKRRLAPRETARRVTRGGPDG